MRLTIRLLGRELLLVDLDPTSPEPAPDTIPAESEHVQSAGSPFGFWGGSGGYHERAWANTIDRPIDT